AVNASGDVFIVDGTSQRIRRLNAADGFIYPVAGTGSPDFAGDGGPATSAAFNSPQGIVADLAGNVYIADTGNNRVRKIAPDGTTTTFAGTGIAGFLG